MVHQVYLSLGSNIGDRAAHLRSAIDRLKRLGTVVMVSSFYETEPVELTTQPWFLNCALRLDTERTPEELLREILALEQEMGRQRRQSKGPRTIDIDILLFGELILQSEALSIPHPAMQERRFVLEPLSQIAPRAMHPVVKKTVSELRDALPVGQAVRRTSDAGPRSHLE